MTAPSVGVLVRLDRSRPGAAVARDLTAAGMHVERVLGRLGVVSGSAPAGALEGLGGVPGVSAVERDREVRTG